MHVLPFIPHPLLRGAHAQTVCGVLALGMSRIRIEAPADRRHIVKVAEGDAIVLHDDAPIGWQPGGRVTLLVHGLCGDHQSPYIVRIGERMRARGVRTFRMDLRGAGASLPLAKKLYHSGRSDDIAAAVDAVADISPGSPISLVGFSLGGNLILKYLGERLYLQTTASQKVHVEKAAAVSPPADLAGSLARLDAGFGPLYNRYFVRLLLKFIEDHKKQVPGADAIHFPRQPRGIVEFDEMYTAPLNNFRSASEYYECAGAAPVLKHIEIPTLIIASRDDPVVTCGPFERPASAALRIILTEQGGHLGFFARSGLDPDRRWMDWRIAEWVANSGETQK